MTPTPITKSCLAPGGCALYYKRDDLLPFAFGGNKLRLARCWLADMAAGGGEVMVVYGGPRSNLTRCMANLCAARGIECHVVMAADGPEDAANARLVEKLGAVVHPCPRASVASTLRRVMDNIAAAGKTPYYTGGDEFGHGREGVPVAAYAEVYEEIRRQEAELGFSFDLIALPCGTGATQAGLAAGSALAGDGRAIRGFSIARPAEAARAHIAAAVEAYFAGQGKPVPGGLDICVDDSGLLGGYGQGGEALGPTIARVLRADGVALDTTYTGKAFYALERYLEENSLDGKSVLFLHTGGTPLFFDDLYRT